MANVIKKPILNSPYEAPTRYWKFDDDGITDQVQQGWRPSAYGHGPRAAAKRWAVAGPPNVARRRPEMTAGD